MKTPLPLFIILFSMGIVFYSCKKDAADPTADCSSSNRDIEAFFNTIHASSNYELYETMDLDTHEYTFSTAGDLQICGFGYKSAAPSLVYEIKLTDSNNNVIYQGNHSFSASAFDYVSVPPITIQPGTYTLSRTVTNASNLSETIGRITRGANNSAITFPVNMGPNLSILSANFYGSGGPVPNYGIPNIYFEYIEL